MESSQFSDAQPRIEGLEPVDTNGATCDTYRVKLYGKLHFLKRLKPQYAGDIRYKEAFRKEFETGYRLEHPSIVRYISLSDDGILMENVDGETLSQRLSKHPDYFESKKNTEKFLRQLLDAVGCLHSHQVLHLDLKPDNILLTRINSDVKLIDLGCCYTDFAVGKILEKLPHHHIYNKVIARCTAESPEDRYQSVEEIGNALRHKHQYGAVLAAFVIAVALLVALWALFPSQKQLPVTVIQEAPKDSVAMQPNDTLQQPLPVVTPVPALRQQSPQPSASISNDNKQLMEKELDGMMDAAYNATIASFCDSVFPSLTVGRQWEKASSEFHAQVLQAAADVSRKYPDTPESVVIQHAESRFQSLVGYVFYKMRENGK